jgi:hypothetical protein
VEQILKKRNKLEKKPVIIISIIVLILGILIGFRLDQKLNQKKESQLKQSLFTHNPLSDNSLPLILLKRPKNINFVIREPLGQDLFEGNSKSEIESLLSSKNVKFAFTVIGHSPESTLEKFNPNPGIINMGMLDASRIAELIQNGKTITPIYSASPIRNLDCYSEIQFLTNQNINSLDELEGKKIGIARAGLALATITFKKLQTNNIKVSQLHIYTNLSTAIKDLFQKKTDVIVARVSVFSNHEVVENNPLLLNLDNTSLKAFHTTNYQAPCSVIYIGSQLAPKIKDELTNKLMDLFSRPTHHDLLLKGMNVEYIKKITPESWQPIQDLFKDIPNFQLNSFAAEIIKDEN